MPTRILVAGIGNVFLGDDGFGVEVVHRLADRSMPTGVQVADFGIRGIDLAFALMEGFDALVLIDAAQRGETPGTLSLIEHTWDENGVPVEIEAHAMDPVKVLRFAKKLGAKPMQTFIVACEPAFIGGAGDYEDVVATLSEPVEAAIDEALRMVESLIGRLINPNTERSELLCVGD